MLVRPRTTPPRIGRVVLGLVVPALVLATAACSGGEANGAAEPTPSLSLGASSDAASTDPAEDEVALKRLVKQYEKVDAKADQAGNTDPSVYDGLLSPDFAEQLVENMRKYILAEDLHVLGQYHYRVDSVDVQGDQATLEVCTDGHEFIVVPEDQKRIGTGDTGQSTRMATFTAERSAEGWVLTGSEQKDEPC